MNEIEAFDPILTERRLVHLPVPVLHLAFDGALSRAEQRMATQNAFDYGPVPWE